MAKPLESRMKQHVSNAASALRHLLSRPMQAPVRDGPATDQGSLAYRKNKDAIWRGEIPDKYTRVLDLVPGDHILELGAAEGVLSLLLAERKARVIALEMKRQRHEEALQLQALWREQGKDVARCEMVLGDLKDRIDLLDQVDTLVAVRSIYYLRDNILRVFEAVGSHVPNVVLCGNKNRGRRYFESSGRPDDRLGKFNYYASLEGMTKLLQDCGYQIVRAIANGDPIVVGLKKSVKVGVAER